MGRKITRQKYKAHKALHNMYWIEFDSNRLNIKHDRLTYSGHPSFTASSVLTVFIVHKWSIEVSVGKQNRATNIQLELLRQFCYRCINRTEPKGISGYSFSIS